MEFVYKVRDNQGRVSEAFAQAESANVLKIRLQARGVDVIDIKERTRPQALRLDTQESLDKVVALFEQITLKDMVVFSRQFAALVGSGVSMLRTLYIIVDQCPNKKLKRAIDDVRRLVESGLSLSDAMTRQKGIFDSLYISMVRAGEAGGILSEVLKRLADFLEYRQKLNQKVRAAMVYPSVVLLVAVGVFWAMLTFVLPIFEGLFKNIGGELPAYTQFLISLSVAARSIWMVLFLIACIVGAFFLRNYYKTQQGKLHIDAIKLSIPLIGELIRKVSIARFSRTFGTLIQAGVPMLNALEVVKDTAGNAVVSLAVQKIHEEVRQGGTISKPMTRDKLFPPMVTQMVAVGEETGKLDDMLEKIAEFYDMEVENSVDSLTSVLEPIMVVLIGGVVGSVVVGMYLPIFTVINQLR
ncbi:type II secretion system F family protein [bacterium]|nr:type II secretion system F family protein [bacterium]QQR57962.1 MAG: type II secretion system F family protein [Candidatus Melainabacteria bacterium]